LLKKAAGASETTDNRVHRHSRESGNSINISGLWIPALRFATAGMTDFEVTGHFSASC
jgi:hypothetical protein